MLAPPPRRQPSCLLKPAAVAADDDLGQGHEPLRIIRGPYEHVLDDRPLELALLGDVRLAGMLGDVMRRVAGVRLQEPGERGEDLVARDGQLAGALAFGGEQQRVDRARDALVGQAACLREPQCAKQQTVVKRRQRLLAVRLAPAADVLERLLGAVTAERLACGPREARRERERHAEGLLCLKPLTGARLPARPRPLTDLA